MAEGTAEPFPSCPAGAVCLTHDGARLLAMYLSRVWAWQREAWARCGPSAPAPAMLEADR